MRTCVYVVGNMLYKCTIDMIRYNTLQKYGQDMCCSDR